MLINGTGKSVSFTKSAIKQEIYGSTSIVFLADTELCISLSNSEDEIDVSDSHSNEIYDVKDCDKAISDFMNMVRGYYSEYERQEKGLKF